MIGMQTGDNVYSILLTPSLLFVFLFESKLAASCALISCRCRRRLNVSILRQLEMIDSLFGDRFVQPFSPLFLRMGADRRADAEALGWLAGDHI